MRPLEGTADAPVQGHSTNVRLVRIAAARSSKMLRDAWTSGLVKLRCSIEHVGERLLRAGSVPDARGSSDGSLLLGALTPSRAPQEDRAGTLSNQPTH